MRIIKFRGWDKKLRKWFIGDSDVRWVDGKLFLNSDYEICQFTGLTDKNGKEIYEGDIVKYEGINADSFIKDIKYNRGGFYFNMEQIGNYVGELLNVMGNIYENPELLK